MQALGCQEKCRTGLWGGLCSPNRFLMHRRLDWCGFAGRGYYSNPYSNRGRIGWNSAGEGSTRERRNTNRINYASTRWYRKKRRSRNARY